MAAGPGRDGRLTLSEVSAFLGEARERLRAGETGIDLAPYRVVDSSALAALLELRRSAGGGSVRFLNPDGNLRKLAALYGVEGLLFPSA